MDASRRSRTCRPLAPKLEADPGKFLHCALPTSENDFPILRVDVHGGLKHYMKMLGFLKEREIALSPLIVEVPGCRVHVTPLSVPLDDKLVSSCHILQLFSSKEKKYQVDLLVKDDCLYFAAFRRHVLKLNEDDIIRGIQLGPGNWYAFDNEIKNLPEFIHAIPIPMNSGYGDLKYMKPGGSDAALGRMLFQLYMFESIFDPEEMMLSDEFIWAATCVMLIFCETRRSLAMQMEVSGRIDRRAVPTALIKLLHETIHMWGSYSGVVLRAKKDGSLSPGLELKAAYRVGVLEKFNSIIDLIGVPGGELLIAKFKAEYLTIKPSQLEAEVRKARKPGYVPNRMFTNH